MGGWTRPIGCMTRTCALLCKQRWRHPGGRQSQSGSPQKRIDINTSCVLQVAELVAEQRSNNARETSPGRGAQSPTAAAAAAVAAAGAAAVLCDEQAAEQDLEEVSGRAVAVGPADLQQSTHHVAAGCANSHGVSQLLLGDQLVVEKQLGRAGCWWLSLVVCPEGVLLCLLLQWHCVESGGWPFQRLADQLCCDVLSPVWTVRHGAAAGLRELLREQAAAAAVEVPLEDINSGWACAGSSGTNTVTLILWHCLLQHEVSRLQQATAVASQCWQAAAEMCVCGCVWHAGLRKLAAVSSAQVEAAAIANAAWLEDVVMHLLCVLALDRFADYVSDQVGGTQPPI